MKRENKEENTSIEKDSLMWSEEDYDAMQKLTGFDDESISADQKKGLNILIFSIICVICLILGIIIGYNIQPKSEVKVIDKGNKEIASLPQAFYTKLNTSNELYLYELSNVGEEIPLLDLSNTSYKYEFIDNYLYLLIEKNDTLKFYRYKFDKQGNRRDLVKEFTEEYNEFYFKNGYVALGMKNSVNIYDLGGVNVTTFDVKNVDVLGFTEKYLIYSSGKNLNIIDANIESKKLITDNMSSFLTFDNDNILFIEDSKIYEVSTSNYEKIEITEIQENTAFLKIDDYYLFNDGKTLYVFDNEVREIKELENKIAELLYIDRDNIVIILDNYDAYECSLQSSNYYLFNVNSKNIIERKISGCLNYKIINDYVKIK